MCVEWVNDWEVATEDMRAYKVARKVIGPFGGIKYESPTALINRADQGWGLKAGTVLGYKLGKTTRSDEPGIYCLSNPMLLATDGMVLLEVVIPKGTKFRRGRAAVPDESGQTFEMRTINALAVKIVKEFKGKVDKRFNWPVAQYATTIVWNYVFTSTTTTTIYVHLK